MIRIEIIGNIGRDATINMVNNRSVINFSVAHTDKYKDQQGTIIQRTTWVDCSYWADKTTIAQYLKQGTKVFVEGSPNSRAYQKKTDNSWTASLVCNVHRIELLGAPANKEGGDNRPAQSTPNSPGKAYPDASEITEPIDDLPF